MRYLERYAFQFLPAIIKIGDFPSLSSTKNTVLNKKWGKKENNDNLKPRLPSVKNTTKKDC